MPKRSLKREKWWWGWDKSSELASLPPPTTWRMSESSGSSPVTGSSPAMAVVKMRREKVMREKERAMLFTLVITDNDDVGERVGAEWLFLSRDLRVVVGTST